MEDLEVFIQRWYWDEASHEFAREAGAFLFQFMNHLRAAGLSKEALQKQRDNVWLIGAFLCRSVADQPFSPEAFLDKSLLIDDFRLQLQDFPTEVAAYEETYRRLERYVRAFGFGE
jgi:hypothetical protein